MGDMTTNPLSTTTISVFCRHSKECPQRDNPQWRRCGCRKHVYVYAGGKVSYLSAKTRSWEQAEKVAQAEREKRDPVKLELARIAAEEEARKASLRIKESTIESALDQWIAGLKVQGPTSKSYSTLRKVILTWAKSQGLVNLSEVTSDSLDAWIASWSLASNTQSFRLTRVKAFFKWAHNLEKIHRNPAVMLKAIKGEEQEETMPLTAGQFREVIAATYTYDSGRRVDKDRFGVDLRAVFLVMRWTGVRLVDALMLKRSGVVGNRLQMNIQKTGDFIDRVVPVEVIQALSEVPIRKTMHEDQFFWSRKCDHRVLSGMWTPRVRLLNECLNLTNEDGEPMRFRSHMLRDTFAVELLLADMPLESVSKLLCHRSIKVTETHYAPWVKARQRKLESEMVVAMRKMGARFDGD